MEGNKKKHAGPIICIIYWVSLGFILCLFCLNESFVWVLQVNLEIQQPKLEWVWANCVQWCVPVGPVICIHGFHYIYRLYIYIYIFRYIYICFVFMLICLQNLQRKCKDMKYKWQHNENFWRQMNAHRRKWKQMKGTCKGMKRKRKANERTWNEMKWNVYIYKGKNKWTWKETCWAMKWNMKTNESKWKQSS